jgi:pimeloyl-ACP methyl ester carboxylesterase
VLLVALVLTSCTTDRTRRAYLAANVSRFATERPSNPVIVIPGFGITRLFDPKTKQYVWGTPRSMVRSGWPDDVDLPFDATTLSIGKDRLVPEGFVGSRGPVNTAYQLTAALESYGGYRLGADLHAFPYDWRLSALENAALLETFAGEIRKRNGGAKVDVVSHSAGGIVALSWVKLAGGADDVRHLVLIAPPAGGTLEAFRMMVRPERFLRRTFGPEVVATWPSVPELLPDDGVVFIDEAGRPLDLDLWSATAWTSLGIDFGSREALFAASLARARDFRRRLHDAPLPPGIALTVLAGDCVPTARRILVRQDGTFLFYPREVRSNEEPLRARLFEPGDGTVPVSSAQALDARVQLFCDGHQGIAADPNVHRAILRIVRE